MPTITQAHIDKAARDVRAGRVPYDVTDGGTGLVLRVGKRGAVWAFRSEVGRTRTRVTLGSVAFLTLAEARRLAIAAGERLRGLRPVSTAWVHSELVRAGKIAVPAPQPEVDVRWTFAEARTRYLAEVLRTRREATHRDYEAMLTVPELRPLEARKVVSVTRQELAEIVAAIHASGRERHAEHLASVLRPMWTYLAGDAVVRLSGVQPEAMRLLRAPERSPGEKVRKNGKVAGGYLPDGLEVAMVAHAARSGIVSEIVGLALDLLVTTAQRRRVIASAEVDHFRPWPEAKGWGAWIQPPTHRKTADKRRDRDSHAIPLPPRLWARVQAQIERSRKAGSRYLLPQVRPRRAGGSVDGHLSDATLNHRLLDLCLRASPHDIRRAFSTHLQDRGVRAADVKLVMDHNEGYSRQDTLETHYTISQRLREKKPVVEAWDTFIEEHLAELRPQLMADGRLADMLTKARFKRAPWKRKKPRRPRAA